MKLLILKNIKKKMMKKKTDFENEFSVPLKEQKLILARP